MHRGYIKLHRKLSEWEWYHDSKTVHLFLHLLLHANYQDKTWNGIEIKTGQLVSGLHSLSLSTGISVQSVRTILDRLKSTNEITIKTTNKYSIITLCNYSKYNLFTEDEQQTEQQANQQTINKQLTTTNKDKKEKNIYIPVFDEEKFKTFWAVYPARHGKKVGKPKAKELFAKLNGKADEIIQAATNYAAHLTATNGYAKDAERFLANNLWKEWLDAPEPQPKHKTPMEIQQEKERLFWQEEEKRKACGIPDTIPSISEMLRLKLQKQSNNDGSEKAN